MNTETAKSLNVVICTLDDEAHELGVEDYLTEIEFGG